MNRELVASHYLNRVSTALGGGFQKSAASTAASKYAFKGPQLAHSITVRCDLNGYSNWSHGKTVAQKIAMLDHFFSSVVPIIDKHHGIYYRDEGDCIIALFSSYFSMSHTVKNVIDFTFAATMQKYGTAPSNLSVKTIVNFGDIAYFQKTHERGTYDWSADGTVFIHSARFESAVESKARIYLFKDDYNKYFLPSDSSLAKYAHFDKIQIPGMKLQSGWQDIAYIHFNI